MNTEFVEIICKWQTLLGAAIGGIIGLLSALIVAHSVRRRDEVSARNGIGSQFGEGCGRFPNVAFKIGE